MMTNHEKEVLLVDFCLFLNLGNVRLSDLITDKSISSIDKIDEYLNKEQNDEHE